MGMKNAVGYVRVSTNQQAEEDRYGIESQMKAIEDYAAEHGYNLVGWKVDEMSGASDDRPALKEILELTNPPYSAVIVFKNDRLARDTKLYFYYLYTLEKQGVELISTKEEFPEGSDMSNIYRALIQFVAEQERKNIALRTGRGRSMKAACGGYSGGRVPYGYKAEQGRLVINEDEEPVVKYIFAEADKGTPMLTIADNLMDMGYRTRKGTRFHASTIKSVLNNRKLYEGYYKYGKDAIWVEGVQEPILKGAK